jgi:hypothetical protein
MSGRYLTASAGYQLGRNDHLLDREMVTVQPTKEPLCCGFADGSGILGDHGYGGLKKVGQRKIVEADQGHIVLASQGM